MRSERADLLRRLIDKMTAHRTKFNGNGWAYDNLPVRDVLLLLNFIPEGDLMQAAPDREKLMKKLYEMSTQEPCGDEPPNDGSVIIEAMAYIGALETLLEETNAKKKHVCERMHETVSEFETVVEKYIGDRKAREYAGRRVEILKGIEQEMET